MVPAKCGEPFQQRGQQTLAESARRGLGRFRRQPEEGGQQFERLAFARAVRQRERQFAQGVVGGVLRADVEPAAQGFRQRQVGTGAGIRAATAFEHLHARVGELVAKLSHEARLADARVRADDGHLALALERLPPAQLQAFELLQSIHHRSQPGHLFEAMARDIVAPAQHEMEILRVVDALQLGAMVQHLELEGVLDEPTRRVRGQHRSRRRRLLEPRGKVDRQSHRLVALDDDQAGREADPHRDAQFGHRVDDHQARLDRAHRGIFECRGVSEIAHDAVVALRVVRLAALPTHDVGATRMQAFQHVGIGLVAQLRQQRGRAHDVERQARDLAARRRCPRAHEPHSRIAIEPRVEALRRGAAVQPAHGLADARADAQLTDQRVEGVVVEGLLRAEQENGRAAVERGRQLDRRQRGAQHQQALLPEAVGARHHMAEGNTRQHDHVGGRYRIARPLLFECRRGYVTGERQGRRGVRVHGGHGQVVGQRRLRRRRRFHAAHQLACQREMRGQRGGAEIERLPCHAVEALVELDVEPARRAAREVVGQLRAQELGRRHRTVRQGQQFGGTPRAPRQPAAVAQPELEQVGVQAGAQRPLRKTQHLQRPSPSNLREAGCPAGFSSATLAQRRWSA